MNENQAIRALEGSHQKDQSRKYLMRKQTTMSNSNFTNNVQKLSLFKNISCNNLHKQLQKGSFMDAFSQSGNMS